MASTCRIGGTMTAMDFLTCSARCRVALHRSQAAERWDQFEPGTVRGRTLGIVGYGDIGRAVAGLARPLGMEVLALRRHPEPDPLVSRVFGAAELSAMLPACDYVVVAAPLSAPGSPRPVAPSRPAARRRPGARSRRQASHRRPGSAHRIMTWHPPRGEPPGPGRCDRGAAGSGRPR